MNELMLIEPTVELESEFLEMIEDWRISSEKRVPFVLDLDTSSFQEMVDQLHRYSQGEDIPENFVPHTTYWLINQDRRILGVVNIRHRLNERLLKIGGHIGYGIRPSERRKGYATAILRLALEKAKMLKLDKVLVTCSKDNIGSAKTIIKNGGILESEELMNGNTVQRYWIQLK